jgi:aryl-alcohol dehydrogenase-like predicted oxidoreductase
VQARLAKLVTDLGRDDIAELCVAFVRAQDWIDGVVIGMETNEQLARNLAAFSKPPLSAAEARHARAALPRLPEALLDPARWPA